MCNRAQIDAATERRTACNGVRVVDSLEQPEADWRGRIDEAEPRAPVSDSSPPSR